MELLIAVMVVAILSSVAYPSYVQHVQRAQRTEARAALFDAAQFMERYYAAQNTYAGASLPPRMQSVPPGSAVGEQRFTITVSADASAYTVTAAPLGTDPCGTLTLTQSGVRDRLGNGLTVSECWR